jgi:ABC-type uncharacterized transport system permease subunit
MPLTLIHGAAALVALLPAWLYVVRGGTRGPLLWLLLVVALAGPLSLVLASWTGAWHTEFAAALWITITASVAIFLIVMVIVGPAWRLVPLLLPYLLVLGLLALIWHQAQGRPLSETTPDAWLTVHIMVSVVAYALITLGAIAGAAVLIQERALKAKRPTALTHMLPAVAEAERLQIGLLLAGEIVLGAGVLTGIAILYTTSAKLFAFDHKTVFTLLAFAVIGALLILHQVSGVRGRRAARLVLIAYLLITLAYPGVKFVTDVLIG